MKFSEILVFVVVLTSIWFGAHVVITEGRKAGWFVASDLSYPEDHHQ